MMELVHKEGYRNLLRLTILAVVAHLAYVGYMDKYIWLIATLRKLCGPYFIWESDRLPSGLGEWQ